MAKNYKQQIVILIVIMTINFSCNTTKTNINMETQIETTASEKETLSAVVNAFPTREDDRPETFGPAPNRQISQFPESGKWEEELFAYVQTFAKIEVGHSHISGDGGYRAFFLPAYDNLHGPSEQFIIDNEFGHIHDHESHSMHIVLPPEIGKIVFEKKWGEQHPLAKLKYAGSSNYLIYGARNAAENEQLKALMRISYLHASKQW